MLNPTLPCIRRLSTVAFLLVSSTMLTACGETLGARVTDAMDGCIAARNPAFTSGAGATALNTPLPDSVRTVATKIAYQRAFANYEMIAESAANQVTLVCALELASFYKDADVAATLWKYSKHPDAGVAQNARKLLETTQDPLPASYVR